MAEIGFEVLFMEEVRAFLKELPSEEQEEDYL